jgi:hypothetical protein
MAADFYAEPKLVLHCGRAPKGSSSNSRPDRCGSRGIVEGQ